MIWKGSTKANHQTVHVYNLCVEVEVPGSGVGIELADAKYKRSETHPWRGAGAWAKSEDKAKEMIRSVLETSWRTWC